MNATTRLRKGVIFKFCKEKASTEYCTLSTVGTLPKYRYYIEELYWQPTHSWCRSAGRTTSRSRTRSWTPRTRHTSRAPRTAGPPPPQPPPRPRHPPHRDTGTRRRAPAPGTAASKAETAALCQYRVWNIQPLEWSGHCWKTLNSQPDLWSVFCSVHEINIQFVCLLTIDEYS